MDSFPQEGSCLPIFHVLIRCIECPGGRAHPPSSRRPVWFGTSGCQPWMNIKTFLSKFHSPQFLESLNLSGIFFCFVSPLLRFICRGSRVLQGGFLSGHTLHLISNKNTPKLPGFSQIYSR